MSRKGGIAYFLNSNSFGRDDVEGRKKVRTIFLARLDVNTRDIPDLERALQLAEVWLVFCLFLVLTWPVSRLLRLMLFLWGNFHALTLVVRVWCAFRDQFLLFLFPYSRRWRGTNGTARSCGTETSATFTASARNCRGHCAFDWAALDRYRHTF